MFQLLSKLFDSNDKQIRKIQPIINRINELAEQYEALSDDELRMETSNLRKKLGVDLAASRGSDKSNYPSKSDLEKLLPEAFATIREATRRYANHRHFDVQLMAGYFLFTNKVIEVFTGEGKTNAANLPLYLYGLTGRGVHCVTVNDYLARRDAEWNGHIFSKLGLTVAALNNDTQYIFMSDEEVIKLKGEEAKKEIDERNKAQQAKGALKLDMMKGVNLVECTKQEAYACDVVYGTNNEFGFDYLRDNMASRYEDRVQGPLYFAIVDEADSILIDEARTPLIISQSADVSNDLYRQFSQLVRTLNAESDYTIDEKAGSVAITDQGLDKLEKALKVKNLYEDAQYAYHLDNALKAKELYKRDDEYLVRDGEVVIIDEFTGRALAGRRYSEGLHQAIEAKEGVEVKRESRTLATITLQNYFRLYEHLAGMTGTALTEAEEFANIYKLDTVVIPTNREVVREDLSDVVYRTQEGKFRAIVEDIKEHNETGQPVLVGTTSVEKSELLSELLKKEGVKHNVLNAKNHEKEAAVVSEAGQRGQVTIATNMAGRGTDIALGEGVRELGGLYVIGSERHESRRIDNQLRGRSGRQGDPGKSRFFISFEDELMRLFGGNSMASVMGRVGMDDDMPISVSILGRSIENAQKRVESFNYDIRKRLVEYDDVLNQQREIVYQMRRKILETMRDRKASPEAAKQLQNLDLNLVKEIDIDDLVSELERFALRSEESWQINALDKVRDLFSPLNIWILKQTFAVVRTLISTKLVGDMEMDNQEERTTINMIDSILTEELAEKTAHELGYKSSLDFYKEFDKTKDLVSKQNMILRFVLASHLQHIKNIGYDSINNVANMVVLQTIDNYWMEHLDTMGDLREGISMRSIAQKDPLIEYKNEGFRIFDQMLGDIEEAVVNRFYKVRVVHQDLTAQQGVEVKNDIEVMANATGGERSAQRSDNLSATPLAEAKKYPKVGRNDPCPCGSGKKYKKCHGRGR